MRAVVSFESPGTEGQGCENALLTDVLSCEHPMTAIG